MISPIFAFWYWQARRGIAPCQVEKLDLLHWSRICISSPKTLTLITRLAFLWLLVEWDQCLNSDLSWAGRLLRCCSLPWMLALGTRFPWELFLFSRFKILRCFSSPSALLQDRERRNKHSPDLLIFDVAPVRPKVLWFLQNCFSSKTSQLMGWLDDKAFPVCSLNSSCVWNRNAQLQLRMPSRAGECEKNTKLLLVIKTKFYACSAARQTSIFIAG